MTIKWFSQTKHSLYWKIYCNQIEKVLFLWIICWGGGKFPYLGPFSIEGDFVCRICTPRLWSLSRRLDLHVIRVLAVRGPLSHPCVHILVHWPGLAVSTFLGSWDSCVWQRYCPLLTSFCELSYTAAIRPTETWSFLSICKFPGMESAYGALPTHQLFLFRSNCPYFLAIFTLVDPEGYSVF